MRNTLTPLQHYLGLGLTKLLFLTNKITYVIARDSTPNFLFQFLFLLFMSDVFLFLFFPV